MRPDPKQFVPVKVNTSITPREMLKNLRELQELTKSELAQLTRMTQSNISALESNIRNIGRERAMTLAKALKVHPAVILFPDFNMEDIA